MLVWLLSTYKNVKPYGTESDFKIDILIQHNVGSISFQARSGAERISGFWPTVTSPALL